MKQIVCIILLLCLCPIGVHAGIYYVSTDGTASWSEATSQSTPCSASTAMSNASAGDTVYFLDGTYYVGDQGSEYRRPVLQPSNSGTSGNEITFQALNNHGATIVGEDSDGGLRVAVIGTYLEDYIVWDGFVCQAVDASDNTIMAGANFYDTNNSAIKNCEIQGASHDTGGSINYEGVRVEDASTVLIENCYIHSFIETSDNHNTSGFKSYGTDYVTIKNCEFSDNTVGIYIKESYNNNFVIENNWIHGNNYNGIYYAPKGGISNLTIENNVFYDNYNQIAAGSLDNNVNGLVINNNTIVSGRSGLGWAECNNSSSDAAIIYNNIIYQTSTSDFWGEGDSAYIAECDHNRLDSPTQITIYAYGANEASYSTLSNWQSSDELYDGSNPGNGSITDDPQFVNSSGTLSELSDFALANDSPCKGAGRNGGDMGADVSTIGVGVDIDNTSDMLSPPSSLQISKK